MDSIALQTYPYIEHIVIDGGSTDGTMEIIWEYSDKIKTIVSEKDRGIYDAINKGIGFATGDVIGILHSDDIFRDSHTLSIVMEIFNNCDVEAVYGDLIYLSSFNSKEATRYWRGGRYNHRKFYYGWMPPHPATFILKSVYDRFGLYRLDLGTASDYELLLRFMLVNRIKVNYLNETLVYMLAGGKSNESINSRLKANSMDRKAWKVNSIKPYFWTIFMKPFGKLYQHFIRYSLGNDLK